MRFVVGRVASRVGLVQVRIGARQVLIGLGEMPVRFGERRLGADADAETRHGPRRERNQGMVVGYHLARRTASGPRLQPLRHLAEQLRLSVQPAHDAGQSLRRRLVEESRLAVHDALAEAAERRGDRRHAKGVELAQRIAECLRDDGREQRRVGLEGAHQLGKVGQLVFLDGAPAALLRELEAVLAAAEERDVGKGPQVFARRAQQLGALVQRHPSQDHEAQAPSRLMPRNRNPRNIHVDAVRNDMHRHALQARIEPLQGRRDRGRGNHHLDVAGQDVVDVARAHRVPLVALLVDEDAVERIRLGALPQVLERASLAGLAELRVDRLADREEVVADDERRQRLRERVERVPDERRDDDRLDVELGDDLLEDAAVFDARRGHGADRAGDVPGADREHGRGIGIEDQPLAAALADAIGREDHVDPIGVGAAEIAHPPVEPAAPEVHDVQLDRAVVEPRHGHRLDSAPDRLVHLAAQCAEGMMGDERAVLEGIIRVARRGKRAGKSDVEEVADDAAPAQRAPTPPERVEDVLRGGERRRQRGNREIERIAPQVDARRVQPRNLVVTTLAQTVCGAIDGGRVGARIGTQLRIHQRMQRRRVAHRHRRRDAGRRVRRFAEPRIPCERQLDAGSRDHDVRSGMSRGELPERPGKIVLRRRHRIPRLDREDRKGRCR